MHVNGIFGNIQAIGNFYDTVFQVKYAFFVKGDNDFLIFVIGGDGRIT